MNTAPQNYSYNPFSANGGDNKPQQNVNTSNTSLAVVLPSNDLQKNDDFYNHANFVLTVICGSFGILLLIIVGMVGGDNTRENNSNLLNANNIVNEQRYNEVLGVNDSAFVLKMVSTGNINQESYNDVVFEGSKIGADKPIYFKSDFDRFVIMENENINLVDGIYIVNPDENGQYIISLFPKVATDINLRLYDNMNYAANSYEFSLHISNN